MLTMCFAQDLRPGCANLNAPNWICESVHMWEKNWGLTRGKLFIEKSPFSICLALFFYVRPMFVSCSPSLLTKALAYFSASVYVVLEDEDLYQGASVSLSPSLFSPFGLFYLFPAWQVWHSR